MVDRYPRKKPWVMPASPLGFAQLPPDQTSFSGADLCALGGVSERVLAEWRAQGLLPPAPEPRRGARYDRAVARRVCAIGRAGLKAARLPMFEQLIPLILGERAPASPPPTSTPALPPPGAPVEATLTGPVAGPTTSGQPPGPAASLAGSTWRHIELLPGLQLQVADDAAPLVHALVRDVARHFGKGQ